MNTSILAANLLQVLLQLHVLDKLRLHTVMHPRIRSVANLRKVHKPRVALIQSHTAGEPMPSGSPPVLKCWALEHKMPLIIN